MVEDEVPVPKKKEFVRVAIEESDDDEEEETSGPCNIKSNFPLKSLKEIEDHSKMAKKLMQQGGDAFMKKFEERAKNASNKIELIEETPKETSKK